VEKCVEAGRRAIEYLEEIARVLNTLKKPFGEIAPDAAPSPLARELRRAVAIIGAPDLTPMAAVAGTIADAVADSLLESGLTRIMVNNGGDVAIRLKEHESVTVGIQPEVTSRRISHTALITASMGVGGVCASGLGGRSLTRGVADAAVAFAPRASLADAAATAIANATYVEAPTVRRASAESVDPDTDLAGLQVTLSVGKLSHERVDAALKRGILYAEALVGRGVIFGACVAVKGRLALTRSMLPMARPYG
jgi:ApbE superfamily uncharacterized protein (UPF0280 family)